MRNTRIARVVMLGLALGSATVSMSAFAQQRRPSEFQAPREMSEDEIRAAKERSKSNLHAYKKGVTDEVTPVPYLAIGMLVLVFALAAPFALRYYKQTADEINARSGPAVRKPAPRKAAPRPAQDE